MEKEMQERLGKRYTVIEGWIKEHARHAQYSYITIRPREPKLDGCIAFSVAWLQLSDLKEQTFHLDKQTSEIVHVTRYV